MHIFATHTYTQIGCKYDWEREEDAANVGKCFCWILGKRKWMSAVLAYHLFWRFKVSQNPNIGQQINGNKPESVFWDPGC